MLNIMKEAMIEIMIVMKWKLNNMNNIVIYDIVNCGNNSMLNSALCPLALMGKEMIMRLC